MPDISPTHTAKVEPPGPFLVKNPPPFAINPNIKPWSDGSHTIPHNPNLRHNASLHLGLITN